MRFGGLLLLFLTLTCSFSQQRCAIEPIDPILDQHFEEWIAFKKDQFSQFKIQGPTEVYTIPVVFHIIHNGEAIGFGENISEERILDQLDRLNEDFRKLNPRSSFIPSIFQDVEADIQIEFILARQDPNGLPTNGIVRKQGLRSSYTFPGVDLKAESYWNSENYLNIWVAETGSTIGWASFPETNLLPGISGSETNPERDGVVVDDDFIGTNLFTDGSFDSYGQTLTHEIGHFLGLKHIWGDALCGNDFCNDTPEAQTHHGNLGSLPVESPCSFPGPDSCSDDETPDMFMNFMDYTNDECLSMFTEDQKFRMRTVIENSPRRLSLLTSPGLEFPIGILNRDMASTSIEDYSVVQCQEAVTLIVNFTNFGSDEVNTFELNYEINGSSNTVAAENLTLTTGQIQPVEIPVSLRLGLNTLEWSVNSVNGENDENDLNNSDQLAISYDPGLGDAPFRQDFETEDWIAASQNGSSEWITYENENNQSKGVLAFNSSSDFDSWLISPVISLSGMDEAGLFFNMSYGIPEVGSDQLDLMIQLGCQSDFELIRSYTLSNLDFSTSSAAWLPNQDWLLEFVNLDAYAGEEAIRLAFVFINRGGNNFFIDDIELTNNGSPLQPRPEENRMVIYPNPAEGNFRLTLNFQEALPTTIQLLDVTGSIILEERYSTLLNQTLEFETVDKAGIYFLRVINSDFTQTKRILIRK